MMRACQLFGATFDVGEEAIEVGGVGGRPHFVLDLIDVGNSGQVLRFVGAVCALTSEYVALTGDASVRSQRPVQPLLDGLSQLGALATSMRHNGCAPILIKGPIHPGRAQVRGEDSQPVSGLLIASAFLPGITELSVEHPGEKPWIGLTLHWLQRLGVLVENQRFERYVVHGGARYEGFSFDVPGDFSSALFPVVAALLTGSEVEVGGLDRTDPQGDKGVLELLKQMGACIEIASSCVAVKRGAQLVGRRIDCNDCIDALPLLAVVGCFAQGTTELYNARIARRKESDRIAAISHELRKMGARIEEREDGLCIERSDLTGARLHSHQDHRIAMALCVAGLAAAGETLVEHADCIQKSYPGFVSAMQGLGAQIWAL